jgi:hypothetical protein
MSQLSSVVALYESHAQAEEAVKILYRSRFDMTKISLAGKDCHTEEHVVGYYKTGDRMLCWGRLGAFWGGMWGILSGAAFFAVPGMGPVLVAGPLVGWIVAALDGAKGVTGMSALGAGLHGIGFSRDRVLECESALKADRYLLVAHGVEDDVVAARRILTTTDAAVVVMQAAEDAGEVQRGGATPAA